MALITPATANLRSQDDQFLRAPPRELGIARGLAPTCCSERNPIAGICAGDRATGAGQGRHERRVCAQRLSIPRRSVHHKVEATAVIRRDLWGSGAGKPLLWHHASFGPDRFPHDLHPCVLKHEAAAREQAGELVVPKPVDLAPAARATVPTALPVCQRQGQPQAAPQCQVHKVRGKGGCCVGGDGCEPHAGRRAGLGS